MMRVISAGLLALGLVASATPFVAGADSPSETHSHGDSVLAGATSAGSRSAIEGLLATLAHAIETREPATALSELAPDSTLRRSLEARYQGYLGLDSLGCRERVTAIAMRGDTAWTTVEETLRAIEHGRAVLDRSWRRRGFVAQGAKWELVSDDESRFAQAGYTDLDMTLLPAEGRLQAEARLRVDLWRSGEDVLLLQLNRGLQVRAVELGDHEEAPFTRDADVLAVPLPAATSDSIVVTVRYDGAFFNEAQEQGYSQVGIAPGGCFASWVTHWYPHVSGSGAKSCARLTYRVPPGYTVASSGRLLSHDDEEGTSVWRYLVDAPLDYSFAAAHYFHRSETVDGIDVGVFFLQGGEAKADLYIERCAEVIRFLRGIYGFYPFDGYAVVEIPSDAVGTLGGSSEQGMNLFPTGGLPDSEFPLPLLSHEIGHSWWGNYVAGGSAPILDEGLAQLTALLAVEKLAGEAAMRRFLRRGFSNYRQSAAMYFQRFAGGDEPDLPLAREAAGSDQAAALHDLADTKGFFVYQMLREEIGDEAFLGGLRSVLHEHARRSFTLADLRRAWERSAGRDLGRFFSEWFERGGAPDIRFQLRNDSASPGTVSGVIEQVGDVYHAQVDLALLHAGSAPSVKRIALEQRSTPFTLQVKAAPDTVLLDPDYKLLRWTDEARASKFLSRARTLRNLGEVDSAAIALRQFFAQAPSSPAGHCERGLLALDAGELERAVRDLGWALHAVRIWPSGDPTEGRALLGLAKIDDLSRRRERAIARYDSALAASDEPAVRDEASRYRARPFSGDPTNVPIESSLADRCIGTFAVDPGIEVAITARSGGRLIGTSSIGRTFRLVLVEGSRFTVAGSPDVTLEFGGSGPRFDSLAVTLQGRLFNLARTR